MAQPVESARIASYCPIAPLKNAIRQILTPITIYKFFKIETMGIVTQLVQDEVFLSDNSADFQTFPGGKI